LINNISVTLKAIVDATGGQLIGDSSTVVTSLCSIDEQIPDGISFSTAKSAKKIYSILETTKLRCLMLSTEHADSFSGYKSDRCAILHVPSPVLAMCQIVPLFFECPSPAREISKQASIHPSATIGVGVAIGDFCVVGADCVIEDNATLHPHVTLYPRVQIGEGATLHAQSVVREDCTVGKGCIVQNGAVVGAEGFGYTPCPELGIRQVPQVGSVQIADRVDIGANSCVDRGTLGTTKIGAGTKIDNLVQIGHNVQIGSHSILCGQVGIAGSSKIGNQVTIGGMAGVKDHVNIVDGVRVAGGSAVLNDLPEKGDYLGFPAIKAREWWRVQVSLVKLPAAIKELRKHARKK
jgi:UDP-3-O-[3-hydroxymyristoyl] glucosamine N-acyltransferase